MPKNTVGGKKYKQQKHKTDDLPNKPLLEREEGQEYAVVTKLLGNSRVSGLFYDRELKQAREIICILRPGLKKKRQWAKMKDIELHKTLWFHNFRTPIYKTKIENPKTMVIEVFKIAIPTVL